MQKFSKEDMGYLSYNKIKVIKRKAYGLHDIEYFSLIIKSASSCNYMGDEPLDLKSLGILVKHSDKNTLSV